MNAFTLLPLLAAASDLEVQLLAWAILLLAAGVVLTPHFKAVGTGVFAVVLLGIGVRIGMKLSPPLVTGTMLGVMGLMCIIPPSRVDLRAIGGVFFAAALAFYGYALSQESMTPTTEMIVERVVFGVLAIATVGSALGMVASRSAVYSAIWFAMTLLSTGGLFLYQGAQFLGVATVTVYAGAIVVTFLFVIMLAQPDGHAAYDRISWGWFAKPAVGLAAALLLGVVLHVLGGIERSGLREAFVVAVDELNATDDPLPFTSSDIADVRVEAKPHFIRTRLTLAPSAASAELSQRQLDRLHATVEIALHKQAGYAENTIAVVPGIVQQPALRAAHDPQSGHHMARLGGHLFSRHLIAVEVAGTLLLAALVGAVSMLASRPASSAPRAGDAHV